MKSMMEKTALNPKRDLTFMSKKEKRIKMSSQEKRSIFYVAI
jgi:hypothetical protein